MKIKDNIVIGNYNFEIVDILENITVSDSFVVPSNKIGAGNGEAKLYVGQNNSKIHNFFGVRGFEVDCLLSKHNLLSFLDASYNEYNEPSQNYREKNNLAELFKERQQLINEKDNIINFRIKDQIHIEGPRVYINSINSDLDIDNYQLLRTLPLPVLSYFNIYKIKNSNDKLYYYFALQFLGTETSINDSDNINSEIDKFNPGSEYLKNIEEELSNDLVTIKVPFDPNKIKVRTTPSTIGQIINDLEDDFIDLDTEFQRLPNLWNDVKKSRFIESLLLKLPIPAFYFNEKEENDLEVIDGLQRISTIKNFVINKNFKLKDLEFLKEYNGSTYSDLPSTFQRRIKTFAITTYIIEKGTPDDVKYNIFKRVNTGGLELTEQEIRHAINQGKPAELVADLVRGENDYDENGKIRKRTDSNNNKIELFATREGKMFVKATDNRIGSFRMEDRDFSTRFIAFYLIDYTNYEPNLDTFLNKGMATIRNLNEDQIDKLKSDFFLAMKLSYDIFGNDAFRKRFYQEDGRKPINKALFEVLSVTFAKMTEYQRNILKEKKYEFKKKFMEIHHDPHFLGAISQGTAIKENVFRRFKEIERIIKETIEND